MPTDLVASELVPVTTSWEVNGGAAGVLLPRMTGGTHRVPAILTLNVSVELEGGSVVT